ncbi:MAG: aspartate--ammonia ligase [Anaerolineales bacterium]|nr:aspartate--ammonia ligase [Anaerolineae bacterium]PWB53493.1 MAG: aspartate--ammonia ligase [Anaerolineales bacterium]
MEECLQCPADYQPLLDVRQTELAIRQIKEFFQTNLSFELNLMRVTAPLFVPSGTGINDDLNGIEQPVHFPVRALGGSRVEIVQSLAKWKRLQLADFGMQPGEGLYTDMNAIRPEETLDNLHSLYVDQWDWERVIDNQQRNIPFLMEIVRKIYDTIRRTERYICHLYPVIQPSLPDQITFVHSEDLQKRYPNLTSKEREKLICKEHGAVFVIGIGAELADGQPHDGRAPDYDDWSTPTNAGYRGLNGDILVNYPLLDCAYELSSMGIRVDPIAMLHQLEARGMLERKNLLFHRRLLNNELPLSIGGGIGQSRLCMFYLRKAHIGEIQSSLWPSEMVEQCREHNILLL